MINQTMMGKHVSTTIHLETLEETLALPTILKEMNPVAETTTLMTLSQLETAAYAEVEALDTMKRLLHPTTLMHPTTLLTLLHPTTLLSTITLIINMEASADTTSILLQTKLLSNVKIFAMQIQNAWHSNTA